ncbi:probable DEAD-box ATP-dependent RNA helicase 48 [Vigna unguiculata]|uniref:probable DEAD-box ATP-dependent RNA helicase 48 n=1 Tax=Vigna unguiculata TaxID=3917 RepID=UPI001016135A|nr:probable DEAD-box ATP-dependent RNA helicase 48 [Vigna unguiculata]
MNLLLPQHHNLSFSQCPLFHNPIKTLQFVPNPPARVSTVIRMGGGPRTYPGGVSKWVWKRMQAKKAKQLLKARLSRERQIYEMRKRAELKAAVSELERPWEVVERAAAAPNLFSVGADEQVKVLADRFQRPGGFDMWSEKDGPVLFETPDELPSARFFPKGVVHSVKPYRRVDGYGLVKEGYDEEEGLVKGNAFDDNLSEKENGGKKIEFSGKLSEKGKKFEFGAGWSEKGNGNGKGVLLEDVDGEFSSFDVNYGRNGVEGEGEGDVGLRRNGNGNRRRFLSDNVGRNGVQSHGRNGVEGDGRLRRNGNGRRVLSDDVGRSNNGGRSSRLNYERNANGRFDGGEHSPPSSNFGRNETSFDGRLRRRGNGRRVFSKDVVDGSNELHSGGVGSVRKQRGGNSIRGRSGGKFANRTLEYASPRGRGRGRGASSEVYDMGLQQDGSYGFQQKHEELDSTSC